MTFHPKQKEANVDAPLVLESTTIKQVVETKLYALIDHHLSWKPHISFVPKMISTADQLAQ